MRTLTAAPTPSSLRSELDDSDLKCWDLPEGQPPPGQKHAGLPGLDWGGSTLDLMFNEITKYWHEKGNLKKKKCGELSVSFLFPNGTLSSGSVEKGNIYKIFQ